MDFHGDHFQYCPRKKHRSSCFNPAEADPGYRWSLHKPSSKADMRSGLPS